MSSNLFIGWAPLVPWPVLAGLGGLALAVLGLGWWRRARGTGLRALAAAALLAALANPSLVTEDRDPLPDVAVVVADRSPSQGIGDRSAVTDRAIATVTGRLRRLGNIDVRLVTVTGKGIGDEGTRLFGALDRALADIPRRRFAGAVLVTDGQVHDVPRSAGIGALPGPIHVLLTGRPDEGDRRLDVVQAPSFGLVGKTVQLTLRVDDLPSAGGGQARVRLRKDGGPATPMILPLGREVTIDIALDHAGPTVVELEADPGERELTLANNRAVVVVNGVRDRLRVLLVSGEPHPGQRAWRNLLKSDPSVDLVHFTILRPPEKQDGTPVRELSLITFPVRELFELKLDDFDLIIFDRYRRRGVLPRVYMSNIVDYVRGGGALLAATGPSFASPLSIYQSPLGDILPGAPSGRILERGFRPTLTGIGLRHPVTADLPGASAESVPWGRWFRQIDVSANSGQELMRGVGDRPLLLLDRVGKGRVAQILSDQMWLWSRNFEGGGPQAELLRRLAHWLMKEPELEENRLTATVVDDSLRIVRRSLAPDPTPVVVTAPSGRETRVQLVERKGGRATATVPVSETGLYRIRSGERTALVAVGTTNPLEFSDVRATEKALAPVAAATGGGLLWAATDPEPEIRRVRPGRDLAGAGVGGPWIGFRANGDFVVTGVRQTGLLPGLAVLILVLAGLASAWRREGR